MGPVLKTPLRNGTAFQKRCKCITLPLNKQTLICGKPVKSHRKPLQGQIKRHSALSSQSRAGRTGKHKTKQTVAVAGVRCHALLWPASKTNTMQTNRINTVILDLGQVIVPVDQDRTLRGLSAFASPGQMQSAALQPFFGTIARFENGDISNDEFLTDLDLFLHQTNPDLPADYPCRQTLADIWNAMIPELPAQNLTLLKKIRQHYELYLLSNTNGLHIDHLDRLLPKGSAGFASYFDRIFCSYAIKMHKPDPAIYQHVCQSIGRKPENCIFVDDRAENIESARGIGLNAIHLTDFNLGKLFQADGRLA